MNNTETQHTKTQKQLVPQLRFSEFEGSFNKHEFDEITDITRLAGYEYSQYWKEDENEEIIALRGYNIGKGRLELVKLAYISNELSLQLKRSRLYVGDIVYPCVGTIGNAVVIEENDKYHIQQNIAKITCKKDISPYYIVQFLISHYGMREVYRFNASGAQPNVLVGSLRRFRINLPTLHEQQKIASFLSSVDTKLQQLTQKKELLEQYKKGVMQQLFSQKLRFKIKNEVGELVEPPDWEEKKLGSLVEIIGGGTPDTNNPEYWNGHVNWFTPSEITGKYINSSERTITELGIQKSSAKLLPKGTVLFTSRATIAELSFAQEECTTNQGFQSIVAGKECNSEFIYYWILQNRKEFIRRSQGSTFLELSKNEMKKIKVSTPCFEEQQKIANYLGGLDTKIESVAQQITQTQQFKKGLLQQMFV